MTDKPATYQIGGTHYCTKTVQPWDAMRSWLSTDQFEGYLRGNVIKYLARYADKNGAEDLQKAQHYLSILITEVKDRMKDDTRKVSRNAYEDAK